MKKFEVKNRKVPVGIEEVVTCVGFDAPIDADGNWRKTHINPANAEESDWTNL